MAGKANSKYTAQEVIDAIAGSLGIKTQIARKLDCDRHTVKRYIETLPTVKQAWIDERLKMRDMADTGLADHLTRREWKAIAFVLTHMTDEGGFESPTQRQEISGAKGGPIIIVGWDDPDDQD